MVDGYVFWKAALVRAIHTALQTMIAMIPAAVGIDEIDWLGVVSTAALAGVVSLLKSGLVGMPEVQPEPPDDGEGGAA